MTEKELFQKALDLVLDFEGYKTEDTGGRTVYGISEHAHPDEVKQMWALPPEMAKEIAGKIYREKYWSALPTRQKGYTKLHKTVEGRYFAIVFFDTAVNCGVEFTQETFWKALKNEGKKNIAAIADYIIWERLTHYATLAKSDKYRPYLRGWLIRVIKLHEKACEIARGEK